MPHSFVSHRLRFAAVAATLVVIAGCASTPPAPVQDRSTGTPRKPSSAPRANPSVASGEHVVARGDTLYSIAFRNGLDYRELARINRIAPPYTIYVGQRVRLSEAAAPRVAAAPAARQPARPEPAAVPPRAPTSAPKAPMFEDVPAAAATPPPSGTSGVAQTPSAPPPVSAGPATPPPPAGAKPSPPLPAAPAATSASSAGISWRWPADGARLAGYVAGDPTRQGIDIGGKSGDPVRAAADGEVVYSGNGLIGYGELIIIKHSPALLSAYGHNRRRLVQEGDKIKAGQQIAEMGSSSASREMLHFEIRRNGKPVDPAAFLPPR